MQLWITLLKHNKSFLPLSNLHLNALKMCEYRYVYHFHHFSFCNLKCHHHNISIVIPPSKHQPSGLHIYGNCKGVGVPPHTHSEAALLPGFQLLKIASACGQEASSCQTTHSTPRNSPHHTFWRKRGGVYVGQLPLIQGSPSPPILSACPFQSACNLTYRKER